MQLLFSKRQYNSVWGTAEFAHPPWVLFGGRKICTVLHRFVVFFQDMCYWTEKRRVKLSGSSSSFLFYWSKMRKNSDIKQSIWFRTLGRHLAGFPLLFLLPLLLLVPLLQLLLLPLLIFLLLLCRVLVWSNCPNKNRNIWEFWEEQLTGLIKEKLKISSSICFSALIIMSMEFQHSDAKTNVCLWDIFYVLQYDYKVIVIYI